MKITKLVSNPSGFDRELDSRGRHLGAFINLNEELVEIQNDHWFLPKNIAGWQIQDGASFKAAPKYSHKYTFAKGLLLPGQKVKLHTGKGKDTSVDLYWNRSAPVWNNEGDTAYLFDNNGNLVDKKTVKVFTGAIAGKIYKAGNKQGLGEVEINARLAGSASAPGKSVSSGSDGSYVLEKLAPATYLVTASKSGYVSENAEVEVEKGETAKRDFYLSPSSTEIQVKVNKVEVVPEVPDWNKEHQLKVSFKNQKEAVYHFETCLFRRKSSSEEWSEVPGARQSFDGTFDKNAVKEMTFTAPVKDWMDWDWYSKTAFGTAREEKISQEIQYKIWFKAIRNEKEPAFEDDYELEVTVKVSEKRRDALKEYNKQWDIYKSALVTAIGAATLAATMLAGIISAPAAAAAAFAAALAYAAAEIAKNKAEEQFKIMDDR